MFAWIKCVALVTAEPWMAIDAQRPLGEGKPVAAEVIRRGGHQNFVA